MGARVLTVAESKTVDIGPLRKLIGKWQGLVPVNQGLIASGWNVISVPGEGGQGLRNQFVYEVIPYTENLTFSPAVIQAGNRGPVVNGTQIDQNIYGLIYEQEIVSARPANAFSATRGFIAGTPIHAETGLILYIGNPTGGYTIARLATIPHGNALLALGSFSDVTNPGTDFIPPSSARPTNLNGTHVALFDYDQQIASDPQFPNIFNQVDPNTFLTSTLKTVVGTGSITSMTTIEMDTRAENTDGGILNIPFIASNVSATSMKAIFWIEEIAPAPGKTTELLQYTQTINLVFPPTGQSLPIVWPHITVNSLVKVG